MPIEKNINSYYRYNDNGRIMIPDQSVISALPDDGGEHWNRLIFESSPYLLQHAANPVDWYPWSDEAFNKARSENKPIFLSIGYTTCHWCHVMEHESFEDTDVARMMNETFINIKVDREERPDIDNIYMEFTQLMNGRGGWPMTVIMSPDEKPFFTGTYFPKNTRGRRIGMTELVPSIADLWSSKRDSLSNQSDKFINRIQANNNNLTSRHQDIRDDAHQRTLSSFIRAYDSERGGFGDRPKFPRAHDYSYLIKHSKIYNNPVALEMAEYSLDMMRRGGMYDQFGYGFHRYSVDDKWLVPHFEKMLYDQANLVHAYLDAYLITKNKKYKVVVEEILSYVALKMLSPEGGFYSAEDADSEGEEGVFYIWSQNQIREVLSQEDSKHINKVFNTKEGGNFREGYRHKMNIPHITNKDFDFTDSYTKLIISKLYQERESRVHPQKDDKVLTDWNGFMVSSFARAAAVLENDSYRKIAIDGAQFIIHNLINNDNSIYKRYHNGKSGIDGVLDDYAFCIWAMIEVYQLTFDTQYLEIAAELSDYQKENFWDPMDYGFYFTSKKSEQLLIRGKEIYDGAMPSGNSVSAYNYIRLSKILLRPDFEEIAFNTIKAFSRQINSGSRAYTMLMQAHSFIDSQSYEVLILGDLNNKITQDMLRGIRNTFQPNLVLIHGDKENPKMKNIIPYIDSYTYSDDGSPIVYVCKNYICNLPTSNIKRVLEQIR